MTVTWIADALARLRADMASANTSGNVEGLLARYIVGNDPRLGIIWGIDCDAVWLHRSYDPSSLPTVAALGYTLASHPDAGLAAALDDGMQRATARDPLLAGPGAALHDPSVLVGLALAARRFVGSNNEYVNWVGRVLGAMRRDATARTDPHSSRRSSSNQQRVWSDSLSQMPRWKSLRSGASSVWIACTTAPPRTSPCSRSRARLKRT